MRRWEVQGGFGLDRTVLVDAPDPAAPGPGQVRLKMRAWSLNARDVLMIEGQYDPRLAFPWVPLSDGAGEVVAVGPGVTRVAVGDRVCPTFSPSWIRGEPTHEDARATRGGPIPGVLSEGLLLSEHELVRVPPDMPWAEAATLPCAGLTAWSALELAAVGPADTVLILGSGGVSVWALQLARSRGARVVATTSTETKEARLRGLGADHVVRYPETPRWGREVRRWSGHGVDVVIEVGGAATWAESLDAARIGGTVAVIGVVAGAREPLSVLPILMKQIRCQGVFVGHRTGFEALVRAVARHAIRPVVDRMFGFEALHDAVDHVRSGAHVGKVCLELEPGAEGDPRPADQGSRT